MSTRRALDTLFKSITIHPILQQASHEHMPAVGCDDAAALAAVTDEASTSNGPQRLPPPTLPLPALMAALRVDGAAGEKQQQEQHHENGEGEEPSSSRPMPTDVFEAGGYDAMSVQAIE